MARTTALQGRVGTSCSLKLRRITNPTNSPTGQSHSRSNSNNAGDKQQPRSHRRSSQRVYSLAHSHEAHGDTQHSCGNQTHQHSSGNNGSHSQSHAGHEHEHNHTAHNGHIHSTAHAGGAHAHDKQGPAGSHRHDHNHPHSHSHSHSHSGSHTYHDGHHDHGHDDEHCCHEHYAESAISRALDALGVTSLSSRLMHSNACTAISILCFFIALLSTKVLPSALGLTQAHAATLHTVALAVTFMLSGFPQVVESMCIAATGKIDTHVLMSLAVVGTMFMGMAQEGALLVLLFQVSHMLEEKFTLRAKGGLEHLFASIPSQATLVELEPSGAPLVHAAVSTRADAVQIGQHVLVKPGEQVPLDGRVVWGTASVSMAHISGESHPLRVQQGSEVPAGSLNTDGLLVVRVTASTDDSTPARIARMTQEAQGAKPKLQRRLDEIGEIWSKAVIGVTLATLAILPMLGVPFLGAHGALYRAMGVLTAGSPCAVVLVPLAYVCAISTVTRKGVLMKSAAALDLLHQCGTVALDKTGTLTTGDLTLTDIQVLRYTGATSQSQFTKASLKQDAGSFSSTSSASSERIQAVHPTSGNGVAHATTGGAWEGNSTAGVQAAMQYCMSLAVTSNHPVSRAVVAAGGSLDGDDVQPVSAFEQVPGLGIRGECTLPGAATMVVRFGSLEFVKENLASGSPAAAQLEQVEATQRRESSSKAMSFVTVTAKDADSTGDPALMAMLRFEDIVDAGAPAAVRALAQGTWRVKQGSEQDIKDVVMLTGDTQQVAKHVANQLQVPHFRAALKPDDKLAYVTSFRDDTKAEGDTAARRSGLLMMGDGINDAPALAAAHVGVAVASRPDDMVAAAADIIVLNGYGVANLPWLFKIAHKTHTVIQQNLALALLSVVFATLPTLAGVFPLWLAVTLHEGATLLVVLNSLRLLQDPQTGSTVQALANAMAAAAKSLTGSSGNSSNGADDVHSEEHGRQHVPHLVHG